MKNDNILASDALLCVFRAFAEDSGEEKHFLPVSRSTLLGRLAQFKSDEAKPYALLRRRLSQSFLASASDEHLLALASRHDLGLNPFLLDNLKSRCILTEREIVDIHLLPILSGKRAKTPPLLVLDWIFSLNSATLRNELLQYILEFDVFSRSEVDKRARFLSGQHTLEEIRSSAKSLLELPHDQGLIEPRKLLSIKSLPLLPLQTQIFMAQRALESTFWDVVLEIEKLSSTSHLIDTIARNAIGAIANFGFLDRSYRINQSYFAVGQEASDSLVDTSLAYSLSRLRKFLQEGPVILLVSHRGADAVIERVLEANGIEYAAFANGSCLNHKLVPSDRVICTHLIPSNQSMRLVLDAAKKHKLILCMADQFMMGRTLKRRICESLDFHVSEYSFRLARALSWPLWFCAANWNLETRRFSIKMRPELNVRSSSSRRMLDYICFLKSAHRAHLD